VQGRFEGDDKKGRQLFLRKKCTVAASLSPNVKSWLR